MHDLKFQSQLDTLHVYMVSYNNDVAYRHSAYQFELVEVVLMLYLE